tara:strand:+ start:3602 stop:4084 length:483 start_codon:yes stop_codon:yes gene_type:complete
MATSKVNLDESSKMDITCKRGDTFSLTITLKDSAGTALPLSTDNYRFIVQVRQPADDRNASRNVRGKGGLLLGTQDIGDKAVTRAGAENNFEPVSVDDSGNATIQASAKVMRSIPSGKYVYDIQYIKPNTAGGLDTHRTVLFGNFTVNEDISEAIESEAR